jgi:hypothetical protein
VLDLAAFHSRKCWQIDCPCGCLRLYVQFLPRQLNPSSLVRRWTGPHIDAEPLHRYHKGGYHPIHLGDSLSSGRYKILHNLGWGSYSTVWAARDTRSCYLRYMDTAHADVLLGHKRMLLSKYRYPNQTTRAKKSLSYVP